MTPPQCQLSPTPLVSPGGRDSPQELSSLIGAKPPPGLGWAELSPPWGAAPRNLLGLPALGGSSHPQPPQHRLKAEPPRVSVSQVEVGLVGLILGPPSSRPTPWGPTALPSAAWQGKTVSPYRWGSSVLGTPSLPWTHSAGDRGALGVQPLCAGDSPLQKLWCPPGAPWGSVPALCRGVAGSQGGQRGGGWEQAPVAGGDSGGLRGGWSQPPPTTAPVGSRGAGASGSRWISTPGWGPSPVGFAQLPVSHGRRAVEAAGAWGSGGAAGAPGVWGRGRRHWLQRAAGGSALGLHCLPAASSAPPSCCSHPGGAPSPPPPPAAFWPPGSRGAPCRAGGLGQE